MVGRRVRLGAVHRQRAGGRGGRGSADGSTPPSKGAVTVSALSDRATGWVNRRSTMPPENTRIDPSRFGSTTRFGQPSRAIRRARHPLLIPRSQVRFLPGPSRIACKWQFRRGETRGNHPRVNFRLLTRASTPEKARSSASGSEPSQHILNPKVAESERGPRYWVETKPLLAREFLLRRRPGG
jgi:hypothetical protein